MFSSFQKFINKKQLMPLLALVLVIALAQIASMVSDDQFGLGGLEKEELQFTKVYSKEIPVKVVDEYTVVDIPETEFLEQYSLLQKGFQDVSIDIKSTQPVFQENVILTPLQQGKNLLADLSASNTNSPPDYHLTKNIEQTSNELTTHTNLSQISLATNYELAKSTDGLAVSNTDRPDLGEAVNVKQTITLYNNSAQDQETSVLLRHKINTEKVYWNEQEYSITEEPRLFANPDKIAFYTDGEEYPNKVEYLSLYDYSDIPDKYEPELWAQKENNQSVLLLKLDNLFIPANSSITIDPKYSSLDAKEEIPGQRTLNSKTFLKIKPDLTQARVGEFHVGHINYQDRETGQFEPIDVSFREQGDEFVVDRASYQIRIPKRLDLNKVKFWANQKWLDIEPIGVKSNIEGKITDDPETGHKGNTIRFDNAYSWGIHLEFVCRAGSVKKYVVFDQKPTQFDWQFRLAGFDEDKHILWQPKVFDSNGKTQNIEYDIKDEILTKHLPEAFFNDAVYPIRTDTTTSYYAGAGDGMAREFVDSAPSQEVWDTAHDGTGYESDSTGNNNWAYINVNGSGNQLYIYRDFLPIDTSGLGSGAVISAAVLKAYGALIYDEYNGDGYDYVAVVKTFQASTSELVTADYEDCGYDSGNETGGRAKYLAVKGSADIDLSGLSSGSYQDLTLNETGRGWIAKTGTTMLGLREGHDIEDNYSNPGAAQKRSGFNHYYSEYTGTDKDPYLSVTYKLPPGWAITESECNALSGWHWYTTNGRNACWSKTLADAVSWNKGVGNDTDVTGAYTCASGYTLQQRMVAAAKTTGNGAEWYKIVSNVAGTTITSSHDGSAGYSVISALAISDCMDGIKDLGNCMGCTTWSLTNTWLRNWAGESGKSALPYLATDAGTSQSDNDYWDACTQSGNEDQTLGCTSGLNYFYLNRKVCGSGDTHWSWVAACGRSSDGANWDTSARDPGYSSCDYQTFDTTSSTADAMSFRVVVRPGGSTDGPTDLLCEGATNPTGVMDTTPEFSAMYYDSDADNSSAYQVQVIEDGESWGWDVSKETHVQARGVAAEEFTPTGVFFKPDGTKMYIIGESGDEVNEYNLSTPWNISTETHVQARSVSAEESDPSDIFFSPDGDKMYVIGYNGENIDEYSLSTPWDISTETWVRVREVWSETGAPRGVFFKPDGTKMYVTGSDDAINEYNLSTPWNISTETYVQERSVSAEESDPRGIFFKSDGSKMYVVGNDGAEVNEYNLSTPWDISSETHVQARSVADEEAYPQGIFFNPDGTKMYVAGYEHDEVNEYNLLNALWDSGKVTGFTTTSGQRCADITYGGTALPLNGAKYHWRIKFWDTDDLEGEWSTETAHFTMSSVSAPTVTTQAVDTIEEITATGHGTVTNNGGENPTRYIEWGLTTGYGSQCDAGVGTGAYSCGITGLSPGTLYHARAKATNSAGTGTGGDVTFTTKPNPPTGLGSSSVEETTATVSWSAPAAGSVTGYYIRYKTGSYPTSYTDGSGYTQTGVSKGLTSLSPGTKYYCRVWSYKTDSPNAGGCSDSYSEHNFTTKPNPPTTPGHTSQTTSGMTLTWAAPVTGDYKDFAYGTTSACTTGTITKGTLSKAFSGYGANEKVDIYLCTRNGVDVHSDDVLHFEYYTSANQPTSVTVDSHTTVSMTFSWATGGAEDHYHTAIDASSGGSNNISPKEYLSLGVNTSHYIGVCAVNGDGDETSYITSSSAYTDANAPAAPTMTNVTVKSVDVNNNPNSNPASTEFVLYFEAGTVCDGTGGWYIDTYGFASSIAFWQTDATWGTITVHNLDENANYAFCAKARNGDNDVTGWGSGATDTSTDATPLISAALPQPSPQTVGGNTTFVVEWSADAFGETAKVRICKTNTLVSYACDTGQAWCESGTFTDALLQTCQYTTQSADVAAPNTFYAFICDNENNCTIGTAGTFSVNDTSIRLKGGTRLKGGIRLK